jgi:CSLREA domain-containing protein
LLSRPAPFAAQDAPTDPGLTTTWTFSGHVYDGAPYDTSQPIFGVTIKVYGSNNPASREYYGTYLRETITNRSGYWELDVYDDDGNWEYYHLVETDKAGYLSLDATSVGGTKAHANCISYVIPLARKALDQNTFWDRLLTTPTATRTPTRTATATATPHPSRTASVTATTRVSATPSPTQTPQASATATTPPSERFELAVNTTADHDDGACDCLPEGDCTLREAINRANELPGQTTILFAIPADDPGHIRSGWVIRPLAPLPALARDGLVIDGLGAAPPCGGQLASDARAAGTIVLDGSQAPRGSAGLMLHGAGQMVLGLQVSNWPGSGLILGGEGCHDSVVAANELLANRIGVQVIAARDNTIGGPHGGNRIAGNSLIGIQVVDPGAEGNRILGNRIGTDAPGRSLEPNGSIGVLIAAGARFNAVGGAGGGEGNVIAGSYLYELRIEGGTAQENSVDGNYIGVASDGVTPLGPVQSTTGGDAIGISLAQGAQLNTIGWAAGNLIGGMGIGVELVDAPRNSLEHNGIGSTVDGLARLGNRSHGVRLLRSLGVTLRSNTIAHNGGDGVLLEDAGCEQVLLSENRIWDNGGLGIRLLGGANQGLQPPAIDTSAAGAVSGSACPGCLVQVYSGPDEEGKTFQTPAVRADMQGQWSWAGTLSEAQVTALAIDGNGNTSEFSSSGLLFTGGVSQSGASPNAAGDEPIAGVQVGLYGSDEPGALGERLTSVATGPDGSFALSYDPARARSYARYTLAVVDPAVEDVTARSDSGGQPTDQGWLVFTVAQPAGDALDAQLNWKWPDNWFHIKTVLELWPDLVVAVIKQDPGQVQIPPEQQQPEDFIIDGIEVTQAIQQFAGYMGSKYVYNGKNSVCATENCLPLVAGRPALVRVYAGVNKVCPSATSVGNVTVDLYVTVGGQTTKHSAKFKPICVHRITPFDKNDPRREYLVGSANFYVTVPAAGTVNFYAEVNKNGGWLETDPTNNRYPATGTENVMFKAQRKLDVGYVMLDYHPKPPTSWSGYKAYTGSSMANATWCASSNAYGLAQDILPVASFTYHMIGSGQLGYTQKDVREDSGTSLILELRKQWQALKAAGKAPDQLVAWLPKGATAGATLDGAADAPPPVWTGQGHALFYEEGWTEGLAHEVGHNYKLYHAPCPPASFPGGAPANIDAKWPYNDTQIHEVGYSMSGKNLVSSDHTDIMSYCVFRWITPYHWNKLVPELSAVAGSQLAGPRSVSIMLVSGRVSAGGGALGDLQLLPGGGEPSAGNPDGTYELVLLNAASGTLSRHRFAVSLQHHDSNEPLAESGFVEAVEWPAGVYRVRLERDGQALDERRASLHAPEIVWLGPGAGTHLGGLVWAEWQGRDEDGDGLLYDLYYSADEGATWLPVALGLEEASYAWNAASLPASKVGQLRVVVSDGLLTASVTAGPFLVDEQPPQVSIAQPVDHDVQPRWEALVLRGSAYDVTDGVLPSVALGWWSDRQGLLGRGETLILPPDTLTPGWHEITLRATDHAQLTGQESVTLYVGDRLYLPLAWRP